MIVAIVLLTTACSSSTPDSSNERDTGRSAEEGASLLEFRAPQLGGGQVIGSEFVGKDVALWFWAPW